MPELFVAKAPPDHALLSKKERKQLVNDTRVVAYATLSRNLRSTLEYETPYYSVPQPINLNQRCERIVESKAYAMPSAYKVKGQQQFAMVFWCKLKVADVMEHRNRGNSIVVAGRSFEDDDDSSGGESSGGDDGSEESSADYCGGGRKSGGGGGSGGGRKHQPACSTKRSSSSGDAGKSSHHNSTAIKPEGKGEIKHAKIERDYDRELVDLVSSQGSIGDY